MRMLGSLHCGTACPWLPLLQYALTHRPCLPCSPSALLASPAQAAPVPRTHTFAYQGCARFVYSLGQEACWLRLGAVGALQQGSLCP